LGSLTLIDYLDFRLRIADRTPDAPVDPFQKANWILEKLSEQVSYYSDKDTIKTLFSRDSKVPLINPWLWYWLSPEGRTLFGLAFDWEALINRLNEQLGFEYSNKLSNMLFSRVVYFEALAAIQGVLTFGSLHKNSAESFHKNLLATAQNAHFSEFRIKAPQDKFSQPLSNPYSHEDINSIINLFQFLDANNWTYVLRRLSAKSIFSGISFTRHEISFFFLNEEKVFTTTPLFKVNGFSSKTWLVHKLPFKFIDNIFSASDISIDLMWEDVIKVVAYLRLMNPSKRKRGKLIDYIPVAVPQQGNVSYGWNWISLSSIEASFTEDRVLTLGNLLIMTRGRQKAIQIDLIDNVNRISSIFSYSKIFDSLKSSSRISFESAISHFMKKNRGFAWVLAILLAMVQYFLTSTTWQTLPVIGRVLLSVFVALITRIIINPLWKKAEEQLAIIRPEDKILETE